MDSLVYPNCFEPWDTEGDRVGEEAIHRRREKEREAQLNSFPSIYLPALNDARGIANARVRSLI